MPVALRPPFTTSKPEEFSKRLSSDSTSQHSNILMLTPDGPIPLLQQVRKQGLAGSLATKGHRKKLLEENSKKYRRSVYFVNNLKKGQVISKKDVRTIRPGFGIPPKYINALIGKHVSLDVERGDPVSFEKIIEKIDKKNF